MGSLRREAVGSRPSLSKKGEAAYAVTIRVIELGVFL